MAEMRTEQKSVLKYLSENKFCIPLYQRKYVWGEDECQQLWDDVMNFFENKEDNEDTYFLGTIVVFKQNKLSNIIDGQQRTATLSLLIKAMYDKAITQKDSIVSSLVKNLASCLWDTDEYDDTIYFDKRHLNSDTMIEIDNKILTSILSENFTPSTNKNRSLYEQNYLYFKTKLDEFATSYPTSWFKFCNCLLRYCIVLPIECDGQENALRIFNTLNNRGISLSIADIFKGIIFESKQNEQDRINFANKWRDLENKIANSPYLKKENIGFLFAQYEHIIRALNNELDTVIPSTLEFFTKKDKANSKSKLTNFAANKNLLTKQKCFDDIQNLAEFWHDPTAYFSPNALKFFNILESYENKIWQMALSMIFYIYKPEKSENKNIFDEILPQIVAYLGTALLYGKAGKSGILWGFMKANVNLKNKKEKIFETSQAIPNLQIPKIEIFIENTTKMNAKKIRFLLYIYTSNYEKQIFWWNKNDKNYSLINCEIEHIFPKKWQSTNYQGWSEKDASEFLEHIGNKMLLEKKENILAGNGYFEKKKQNYRNSYLKEPKDLANFVDWNQQRIIQRDEQIYKKLQEFFSKELF